MWQGTGGLQLIFCILLENLSIAELFTYAPGAHCGQKGELTHCLGYCREGKQTDSLKETPDWLADTFWGIHAWRLSH